MPPTLKIPKTVMICVVGALIAGCSVSPYARQRVSGTVTFEGQPLEQGTIQFLPITPGTSTIGVAAIANGKFLIAYEDGLVPATYRVLISSGAAASRAEEEVPGESRSATLRELIPAKYNSSSTLSREVKAAEKNEFDFELTK